MSPIVRIFQSVIALLFLWVGQLSYAQSINYDQALADLLMSKKWFDAQDYYLQHKDSIRSDFVQQLYQAETNRIFNRQSLSITLYKELIKKNTQEGMNTGLLLHLFYNPLLQTCIDAQDPSKGIAVCNKLIKKFKTDTSSLLGDQKNRSINIKSLSQIKSHLQKMKKIKWKRSAGEVEITLLKTQDSLNYVVFPAQWNGVTLRTAFDTGASHCYIWNRSVAEQIGVKLNTNDTVNMNNGTIRTLSGTIKNLKFGNYTFQNIPVYVSLESADLNDPKQAKCDSTLNSLFDIVLGTPIITKLGTVLLDFEKNSISFPTQINQSENTPKNIYLESGMAYLDMQVAGQRFVSQFDTGGGNGLIINSTFYEQNKDKLTVEGIANSNSLVGGCNALSYLKRDEYLCKNVDIRIGNMALQLKNDCTISKDKENDYSFGTESGGALGNLLFSYCKKALFNFDEMVFSIIR